MVVQTRAQQSRSPKGGTHQGVRREMVLLKAHETWLCKDSISSCSKQRRSIVMFQAQVKKGKRPQAKIDASNDTKGVPAKVRR